MGAEFYIYNKNKNSQLIYCMNILGKLPCGSRFTQTTIKHNIVVLVTNIIKDPNNTELKARTSADSYKCHYWFN